LPPEGDHVRAVIEPMTGPAVLEPPVFWLLMIGAPIVLIGLPIAAGHTPVSSLSSNFG
jgi:hypothetical protein